MFNGGFDDVIWWRWSILCPEVARSVAGCAAWGVPALVGRVGEPDSIGEQLPVFVWASAVVRPLLGLVTAVDALELRRFANVAHKSLVDSVVARHFKAFAPRVLSRALG